MFKTFNTSTTPEIHDVQALVEKKRIANMDWKFAHSGNKNVIARVIIEDLDKDQKSELYKCLKAQGFTPEERMSSSLEKMTYTLRGEDALRMHELMAETESLFFEEQTEDVRHQLIGEAPWVRVETPDHSQYIKISDVGTEDAADIICALEREGIGHALRERRFGSVITIDGDDMERVRDIQTAVNSMITSPTLGNGTTLEKLEI